MIFYGAMGLAVAVAIRAVGALLTFTLLVAPGASAYASRSGSVVLFNCAPHRCCSSLAGVVISYQFDLPTGSTIVALLVGFFVISFGIGQIRKTA